MSSSCVEEFKGYRCMDVKHYTNVFQYAIYWKIDIGTVTFLVITKKGEYKVFSADEFVKAFDEAKDMIAFDGQLPLSSCYECLLTFIADTIKNDKYENMGLNDIRRSILGFNAGFNHIIPYDFKNPYINPNVTLGEVIKLKQTQNQNMKLVQNIESQNTSHYNQDSVINNNNDNDFEIYPIEDC